MFTDAELPWLGVGLGVANVFYLLVVSLPLPAANAIKPPPIAFRPKESAGCSLWLSVLALKCLRVAARIVHASSVVTKLVPLALINNTVLELVAGRNGKSTLFTISGSAAGEAVRWSLEATGEPFEEKKVSPAMLPLLTLLCTGAASPSYDAPILVTGRTHKRAIAGVGNILGHLASRHSNFCPTSEAADIIAYLESCFADAAAHVGYAHLFSENPQSQHQHDLQPLPQDLFTEVTCRGLTPWQRWLAAPLLPAAARDARRQLRLAERLPQNVAAAISVFDVMEKFLSDGRSYLAGDRFGAADIVFCALAMPLLLPPETASEFLPLDPALPPKYAEIVRHFRETRAGRFALLVYARQRRPLEAQEKGSSRSGSGGGARYRRRGRSRSAKQTVNSASSSPPMRVYI